MDWSGIEANWKELKGQTKNRPGKLTDDDLMKIDGRREQPVGKLQERYSIAKEELERDVGEWGCGQVQSLDAPS